MVYNILIDIHGKSGQWAKAVEVLGMLQAQVCVCVAVGGLGRRGGAGTEVLDERCSKLALTWQHCRPLAIALSVCFAIPVGPSPPWLTSSGQRPCSLPCRAAPPSPAPTTPSSLPAPRPASPTLPVASMSACSPMASRWACDAACPGRPMQAVPAGRHPAKLRLAPASRLTPFVLMAWPVLCLLPSLLRLQPTGTTYTSLISAYGKAGQVEEAVRIYQVGLYENRARARVASRLDPGEGADSG